MSRVTATAKQIMTQALPIQCLEATVLACYLTNDWINAERIPLSFKSKAAGNTYRHIVLAVKCTATGKWGGIGLSRKQTLAYKPIQYDNLADLVTDYKESYQECWHELCKVYVGFPFSHDPFCPLSLHWRVLRLDATANSWERICVALNDYDGEMMQLASRFYKFGKLNADFDTKYRLGSRMRNSAKGKNDEDADSSDFESSSPRKSRPPRLFNRPATSRERGRDLKRTLSLPPLKQVDSIRKRRPMTAVSKRATNETISVAVAPETEKTTAPTVTAVDSNDVVSVGEISLPNREEVDDDVASTPVPPTPAAITSKIIASSFLGV